jgi:hypothetical protein
MASFASLLDRLLAEKRPGGEEDKSAWVIL